MFDLIKRLLDLRKFSRWSFQSYKMSKDRFFSNPFPDFTPENAHELVESLKVQKNQKFSAKVYQRWEAVEGKFPYIDKHDYSVYTGTSGLALLKLKKDPNNPENLKEILELIPLKRLKNKRHTFLCGDAGPLAIAAVVHYKLGNHDQTKLVVERLLSMKDDVFNINSDLPNEYLYGRAGYLYAVLFVNKNVHPPPFPDEFIRKIVEIILICGKNEAKAGKFKCPLMYQWHDSYYLGAAHGLSGILYLLLQIKENLMESEMNTLIKPTIDYLSTIRFPSGNYPSSMGRDVDKYVQWCHGAPGFVYLFSQAYKVFGDPKYIQLALDAGEIVWQRGLVRKGYSICHGVSGNAYCFLELYQTTQDEKQLYRAFKFAEWCLDYKKNHEEYPPDRPISLFEGIAGPMYFLLDMLNPVEAKFPGYTL
ncbi:glutathione S-transferase LANCL1 [Coccinella septempunctata]|uniref:glutathione S-transferase LANCL1 n=1 Tax=Coccinella septempunctata TaxID=41139 RepID=UPI001D088C03|nr:glutathione S-transferase LANCL1 [Coccinella septempunctata]